MSKIPVIMVEFDVLTSAHWNLLHELVNEVDMDVIVVKNGLQYPENVHKLKRANLILQIIKPFHYTNTYKLRKSFVKYFEDYGYDLEHMACVTEEKADVKNNIVVNKNLKERIYKFYEIEEIASVCYGCQGSGTHEEYDQCGCVEHESSCQHCGGKGKITKLRKQK